ncbi:MAG: thioredoxin-like domain-containing protein [Paludibacteraceae bacterium]
MKQILSALLTALLMVSCQPKGYKISGEATGSEFDSVQVFLTERINRVWQNIDSTIILNGKFELKGKNVDSVRIVHLLLTSKDENLSLMEPMVLENGVMKARVDSSEIVVSGTNLNETFNLYKKEKNRYLKRMDTEYDRFMQIPDSLKTMSLEDSVGAKIEKIEREMLEKDVAYSNKTVNTVIGNYIFMNSFYYFTVAQKEELFAKMDAKTKAIPRISELIKATEIEKKTSTGQPFVDFRMPNPQGVETSLSDFVGKTDYLLIDFWASWCGPCIRSFPELTTFYAKNKGRKFDIVGVSLDREKQGWLDAIKKYNLTWNHLSDIKYWDSEGAKLYAVNSIPATVLIDKSGKIVGRNMKLDDVQRLIDEAK